MAAEGQLIHIASSEESEQDMVLDVAGNLPRRHGEFTPLVLSRRTQSSRLASQTWRFTGDHLVLRETQTLCVQTKKGFESFREGKCSNKHLNFHTYSLLVNFTFPTKLIGACTNLSLPTIALYTFYLGTCRNVL